MHPLLEQAYVNLDRAGVQAKEFKRKASRWIAKRPWSIRRVDVHVGNFSVWSFEVERLPVDLGAIVADGLHNTRKPLDKLLTAYVADRDSVGRGEKIPGVQFPVSPTKAEYEKAVKSLRKVLRQDVADFLVDLECFEGGRNEPLYHLHSLDVDEKHYPFLTPVNLATMGQSVGEVLSPNGMILRLGSPRGQHLVNSNPFGPGPKHLEQRVQGLAPTFEVIGGKNRVVFKAPETDFEFMTTTLGADVRGVFEPSLALKLTTPKAVVLGEVSEVMADMQLRVRRVVDDFRTQFLPK